LSCLITEIKLVASHDFTSCFFKVCPRICNRLAHEFAVIGCNLPSGAQTVWHDVPLELEALVSGATAVTDE